MVISNPLFSKPHFQMPAARLSALLFGAILLAAMFSQQAFCQTTYEIDARANNLPCSYDIRMRGTLEVGTLKTLKRVIKQADDRLAPGKNCRVHEFSRVIYTFLDGGSVTAAIEIGQFVREEKIMMVVPIAEGGRCYSSCVLMLAGALKKLAFSGVGIHRPYFGDLPAGMTVEEVSKARSELDELIRSYFKKVNASQSLLEAMNEVPPEEIRLLTFEEIERYGLNGVHPDQDELEVSRMAHRWAITSSQYRERSLKFNSESKASASCQKNLFQCEFRILSGLPEAFSDEYLRYMEGSDCFELTGTAYQKCFTNRSAKFFQQKKSRQNNNFPKNSRHSTHPN